MKVEVLEDGSGIKLLPEGWEETNILSRMKIHGIVVASSSGDGSIQILDLSFFGRGNKQLILNMEEQATVAFALGVVAREGMLDNKVQSIMEQLLATSTTTKSKSPPIQSKPTKMDEQQPS